MTEELEGEHPSLSLSLLFFSSFKCADSSRFKVASSETHLSPWDPLGHPSLGLLLYLPN